MNIESMRNWQLTSMENNLKTYANIIALVDPTGLNQYRDSGTGWTAVEVLCHLRDYEAIFLERAIITITEELGALPNPSPDDLAAERNYNADKAQDVLQKWRDNRSKLLAFYKEREEADWESAAMHPKRGHFTLHDQLFLTAQHDTLHMEQLTRILLEKK